ncbi:MAG: endonuclease III [Chloroflexi bacterium]|nr:endonuclease III [Chloroflexota bacterium]
MPRKTELSQRVRATDKILVRVFGNPQLQGGDPVEALVGCILSQATTDAQSDAAYDALIAKYPTWGKLRDARVTDIARVIRASGLANDKARYIKHALQFIERERGKINLDFLNAMGTADARKWLMQMQGVGPKTASIVLLFAQKRPVFPVDTHVHRVTRRLGWISEKTSAEQAHELLEAQIPPKRYYALHVNLIRLGREICRAQNPRCAICPLKDLCAYFQRTQ